MKIKITLLFLITSLISFSQNKAFYKKTTFAYEINKKDTINKKVYVTFLDSLRNVIESENNIANAISGSKNNPEKIKSIIEIDNGKLYISADINTKVDTIGKLIYVYDEKGNRTENYQIRNGDTINGQKRIFNDSNLFTKLYNKKKNSHDYFLSMEWLYDDNGNYTECKKYNENNQLIGYDKYDNTYEKNDKTIIVKSSYKNNKGFEKVFKEVKEKNKSTIYYFEDTVGYNYGIKLNHYKGGYSITLKDECGDINEMRLYDANKKLIALMYKKEEKLQ